MLVAIARTLETCLRPEDTVARLGGDEFAILLEDVADAGAATHVADRIQQALALPFTISSQEVFTSASIGIALSDAEYDRPEDLLRDSVAAAPEPPRPDGPVADDRRADDLPFDITAVMFDDAPEPSLVAQEDREDLPFENLARAAASLADHLDEQLRFSTEDPSARRIGDEIIGNLDEDGYLRAALDEIERSAGTQFDPVVVHAFLALVREAVHIVEQGIARPEDVDLAVQWGLGLRWATAGPFRIMDLAGLPTFRAVAAYLYPELSATREPGWLFETAIAQGRTGAAAGHGVYEYPAGAHAALIATRNTRLMALRRVLGRDGPPALPIPPGRTDA